MGVGVLELFPDDGVIEELHEFLQIEVVVFESVQDGLFPDEFDVPEAGFGVDDPISVITC